jgi:hypothetical protein
MVYVRLGHILLQQRNLSPGQIATEELEKIQEAKTLFVKAACVHPSSRTWLYVARACFHLKEMNNTEDALSVRP